MASPQEAQVLGLELTPVEVETAAAVIKRYAIGYHCQIEEFGVVITEDFVAHGTDPVVRLEKEDKWAGTATVLVTLGLGSSNTDLKKGDGSKAAQTVIAADTDLDNGQVVLSADNDEPFQLLPGEVLVFRASTAAGEAGGAYIPFVRLRAAGNDARRTNVWRDNN